MNLIYFKKYFEKNIKCLIDLVLSGRTHFHLVCPLIYSVLQIHYK